MPGQLGCARHHGSAPEARGSFSFFPSTLWLQADPAREEARRRKETFTRRRVLDEAWLEVNTFLPHPTPGRHARSSQASTRRRAGSTGCKCHRGTDKQAHSGTRGLSDPPRCLPGSQPSRQACLSPRLWAWSKHKRIPIAAWWHWQGTRHWGQSEENPSRCQLPSRERVRGAASTTERTNQHWLLSANRRSADVVIGQWLFAVSQKHKLRASGKNKGREGRSPPPSG